MTISLNNDSPPILEYCWKKSTPLLTINPPLPLPPPPPPSPYLPFANYTFQTTYTFQKGRLLK